MSVAALAQSVGYEEVSAQDPDSLTEVPTTKDISQCVCPAALQSGIITLDGLVIDAEMTLASDMLSPNDRMATIFEVVSSSDSSVSGRTRIWHNVSEDQCGVTFDYGKNYTVYAREDDGNGLETDSCLMGY